MTIIICFKSYITIDYVMRKSLINQIETTSYLLKVVQLELNL